METPSTVAETETNQQDTDGTIIVPNPELQAIIVANKLPDDLGQRMQKLFSGSFAQMDEWKKKAAKINITSEDQTDDIALAQEGSKIMLKLRTSVEGTRTKEKKYYLEMGRAIDAVCKALQERIEPIETYLKTKAQFAAQLAASRKETLVANRVAALKEVGHSGDMPGIGDMTDEMFAMLLKGAKQDAADAKIEAERVAAAKEASDRLIDLEAQLEHLGAVYDSNGCYVLANESFDTAIEGISQDEADAVLARFRKESDRLKVQDQTGRNRRETLLKIGIEHRWEDLGKLTDTEWQIALDAHQAQYDAAQAKIKEDADRKERTAARTLLIVGFGATEQSWNDGHETGYQLTESNVTHYQIENLDEVEWEKVVDDFKDAVKAIEDRKARVQRTADRKLQLVALGAKEIQCFDVPESTRIELGTARLKNSEIDSLDDEHWPHAFEAFTNERDRLAREESERLQKERARIQAGNERMLALRQYDMVKSFEDVADLNEQEYQTVLLGAKSAFEAKQALAKRHKARRESLIALGVSYWSLKGSGGNGWKLDECTCSGSDVEDLVDEEWSPIYDRFVAAKSAKDEAEKERQRKALLAEQAAQDAAKKAAEKKVADAAAKKAAAAPDKTKLSNLAGVFSTLANGGFIYIDGFMMPDCKTDEGKAIVADAKVLLAKIAAHIEGKIENM